MMHSAKPVEPEFETSSAPGGDAWRSEVASRVNSYRAKRQRRDEDTPALDFGPAEAATTIAPPPARPAPARPAAAKKAFDTNYYRRMNAEALSPTPSWMLGATVPSPQALPQPVTPEPPIAEPVADPVLDIEMQPTSAEDSFFERCLIEPEPPSAMPVATPPAPEPPPPPANVIVFRRPITLDPPLAPQPGYDELAEPIHNQPRILEVPEDMVPPVQGSLFPEIRLDLDESDKPLHEQPKIEVPLAVAGISARSRASLTDLGIVASAGVLFTGMAMRALPDLPHTKPFFMIMGAVTAAFWGIYHFLFLLYGGRTFGMCQQRIRLSTFNGHTPNWRQRGSRAAFMLISSATVALGFLWALVDTDMLCWHDRLSETFPTAE